jgi:hypothetical protein
MIATLQQQLQAMVRQMQEHNKLLLEMFNNNTKKYFITSKIIKSYIFLWVTFIICNIDIYNYFQ